MAWSSASLSSDELAWLALDKPFLSNNALYDSNLTLTWVAGTTLGVATDPDDSDTDKPASRLSDAKPGFQSSPDSASTVFTIVIDASSAPITFDWFGILGHNLATVQASDFNVQIADNAAFSTNLQTLSNTNFTYAGATDARWADVSLTHSTGSRRYSTVPYARIQIELDASDIPAVGQLVFGRRRQQPYLPDLFWDPTDEATIADDYVSKSGVIDRVSRAQGGRQMSATFQHDTNALQSDLIGWWDDIEGGEQPFFYVDEPSTSPTAFWMMHLSEAVLYYPYTQTNNRSLTISAEEQGPNYYSQDP